MKKAKKITEKHENPPASSIMLERYALFKVMKKVLSNASKRYSVRGAAQAAEVSVFAAKESLDYMLNNKMVLLEKIGRAYQYQANKDSYLTRQWKILFSLEELADAKLVERILESSKNIHSIILYGSAATGRDDEKSDLDILVIADVSEKKKWEMIPIPETRREANVHVSTPMEWRKKAAVDKIYYEHVVIDSILLYGEKPVVL